MNSYLSDKESYRLGKIYGIDLSSGIVVSALDPLPGDEILDLCCAPGGKLCMISDRMKGQGSITGVDIDKNRLSSCRNLCKKYKIPNVRLFLGDGRYFSTLAPNIDHDNDDNPDLLPDIKHITKDDCIITYNQEDILSIENLPKLKKK